MGGLAWGFSLSFTLPSPRSTGRPRPNLLGGEFRVDDPVEPVKGLVGNPGFHASAGEVWASAAETMTAFQRLFTLRASWLGWQEVYHARRTADCDARPRPAAEFSTVTAFFGRRTPAAGVPTAGEVSGTLYPFRSNLTGCDGGGVVSERRH